MQIDDESLMALADGELDEATALELRRRVAADPQLQARLHRFEETRRLLSGLRRPAGDEAAAAEDPLAAMIRAAAAAPRPPRPANLNRRPWLAAAASAVIAMLGLAWWEWANPSDSGAFSPAVIAALESQLSGQVKPLAEGGKIAMIASYQLQDGTFCREFQTVTDSEARTVLACRDTAGWSQRLAEVSDISSADYLPAAGPEALEARLAALGATEPLSPEDEIRALRE